AGDLAGKFMVYYDAPHRPGKDDVNLALTIARQLGAGIGHQRDLADRQRANDRLRENEERLRIATQAGQVGVWDWDIDADRVSWSDSLFPIHGVRKEDFVDTVAFFTSLVHPDDLPYIRTQIERALAGEDRYTVEFRIRRPDGNVAWLYADAKVLRRDGRAYRMIGATV